jgi:hypothetical protein
VVARAPAHLTYADEYYITKVDQLLLNCGEEPITRHRVHVVVDRYPDDPSVPNPHHRAHPLTFYELDLHGLCDGVPMQWRVVRDRDAEKVVALLFQNEERQFPLYPGEQAVISYTYRVSGEKWGNWFTRSTNWPTRLLEVAVDLPSTLRPSVWGVQISPNGTGPFPTPFAAEQRDATTRFSWRVADPPLGRSYRVEWCFGR